MIHPGADEREPESTAESEIEVPDPRPQSSARMEWTPGVPCEFELGDDESGRRLDVLLSEYFGESRAQIQRWLEAGHVVWNDRPARASSRCVAGDRITVVPPQPFATEIVAEEIPLDILHADADIAVLDKAAGMVVHPAPGHSSGTLVNALLYHFDDLAGIGGVERPGIVHRLDRGTSGIMVIAKNDVAHRFLAEQFHEHSIERIYTAFIRALPGTDEGVIERPIGRHPSDRKRMSVRSHSGREARSRWRVVCRYPASGVSRLEVRPETGRTHQIRVHLSSVGMPIVGDPVYGARRVKTQRARMQIALGRPALHASVLGFEHPRSRERMRFEAPLPADLCALLDGLEAREAGND